MSNETPERDLSRTATPDAPLPPAGPPWPDWLFAVIGSMKDVPGFEEALALGREYRQSEYPPEDDQS